jgi:hypothetical protein
MQNQHLHHPQQNHMAQCQLVGNHLKQNLFYFLKDALLSD